MSEDKDTEERDGLPDVGDGIAGIPIPKPIKKNTWKAFGQLCSGLVGIPMAHLEGKAALTKATYEARTKLIQSAADKIAQGMNFGDDYLRLAEINAAQQLMGRQKNIDIIFKNAMSDIADNYAQSDQSSEDLQKEEQEISDDFLAHFQREAGPQNSDEMRTIFGRILAGEIAAPGAFSTKTLKTVGEIDVGIAGQFQKLCSISMECRIAPESLWTDIRAASLANNAAHNGLEPYGLSFGVLNQLEEFGLIISDYNSWVDYSLGLVGPDMKVLLPFRLGGNLRAFKRLPDKPAEEFKINGVKLSMVGMELFPIVEQKTDHKYLEDFKSYFKSIGYDVIPVKTDR